MMLPGLQERVSAVHTLLRLASAIQVKDKAAPAAGVLSARAAVLEPTNKPGAFSGLRLLPGTAYEAEVPALQQWLAQAIIADPPHELRWLKTVDANLKASVSGASKFQDSCKACIWRSDRDTTAACRSASGAA